MTMIRINEKIENKSFRFVKHLRIRRLNNKIAKEEKLTQQNRNERRKEDYITVYRNIL
jgi:hypothetical protein